MKDLACCPFCGLKELEVQEDQTYYTLPYVYFVRCTACGARGPVASNALRAKKLWSDWGDN